MHHRQTPTCKLLTSQDCRVMLRAKARLITRMGNNMPTNWWGRQNAATLNFDPKLWDTAFSAVFWTSISTIGSSRWRYIWCGYTLTRLAWPCNIWRVSVKQWPTYSTLWPVGPVLCTTFVQCLIAFCSWPEATRDVISGTFMGTVVPENRSWWSSPKPFSRNST